MTWTTGTQGVRGVDRGWVLPEDEDTQEARGADVGRDTGFWWRTGEPGGARRGGQAEREGSALPGCWVWPGPSCGGRRSPPLTEGPCSQLPLVLGRWKPSWTWPSLAQDTASGDSWPPERAPWPGATVARGTALGGAKGLTRCGAGSFPEAGYSGGGLADGGLKWAAWALAPGGSPGWALCVGGGLRGYPPGSGSSRRIRHVLCCLRSHRVCP